MKKKKRLNRLQYQLRVHINSMGKIGESRHDWKREQKKEENYNIKSGSEYFFSKSDQKNTREKVSAFLDWVIKNNSNWKKDYSTIYDIPRDLQLKYIAEKMETCSKFTIKSIVSALNKVFNDTYENPYDDSHKKITYEEIGLHCSYKDVTKNRAEPILTEYQKTKNYGQILIAKSFGLRREEICSNKYPVRPESFYICEGRLYVDTIGKGGKFRSAECLTSQQSEVVAFLEKYEEIREQIQKTPSKKIFKEHYETYSEPIFERYDSRINSHYYRREYARAKYEEILHEKYNGVEKKDKDGFDERILIEVSRNLGHNRGEIVTRNYMR